MIPPGKTRRPRIEQAFSSFYSYNFSILAWLRREVNKKPTTVFQPWVSCRNFTVYERQGPTASRSTTTPTSTSAWPLVNTAREISGPCHSVKSANGCGRKIFKREKREIRYLRRESQHLGEMAESQQAKVAACFQPQGRGGAGDATSAGFWRGVHGLAVVKRS